MKNDDRPYINSLKESLKEIGFLQANNTWRKEFDDVIVLCKVEYEVMSLDVDIVFAVWLKALGDIRKNDLKFAMGSSHIMCKFNSFLSGKPFYDMIAACSVAEDNFDWRIQHYESVSPEDREIILESFKFNPPQSLEEKVNLFESIFQYHGLKVLKQLSSEESILSLVKDRCLLSLDVDAAGYLGLNLNETGYPVFYNRKEWA